MTGMTIHWRGLSEAQLAAYQQDQGNTNHCAKFASASAINLLRGSSLLGSSLVSWLETRLMRGSGRYTIFGNHNGSLVFQTANLVRRLGNMNNIPLQVRIKKGQEQDLLDALQDGGVVALVSVTYFQGEEPLISRGQSTASTLAPARWVGGHIMIPGIYDPAHHNLEGVSTPWGFLSSWNSKDQLYWMSAEAFRRTWGRLSFFNMITVRLS
jgi:hypothetical protein